MKVYKSELPKIKRYLLFVHEDYQATGGMHDLKYSSSGLTTKLIEKIMSNLTTLNHVELFDTKRNMWVIRSYYENDVKYNFRRQLEKLFKEYKQEHK